jgi:NADH-quinone oxidoreductase subunit N
VEIDDWGGLFTYAPGLAGLLAIFFFSLAGIPPLAGWFAKFVMFRAVLAVGGGWAVALAVIAVINSVIGLVYYAKVVKSAWMDPVPGHVPAAELERMGTVPSLQFAMVLTVAGVIVLGIFPGIISEIGELTRTLASGF